MRGRLGVAILAALLGCCFAVTPALAQDAHRWGLSAHAGWLDADGTIRLVRGTRKIVTNDIEGGPVFEAQLEYRTSERRRVTFAVLHSSLSHVHEEIFGDGTVLHSRNPVPLTSVLLGPGFRVIGSPGMEMWLGFQLTYNVYGDRMTILSETMLPPTGTGPPDASEVTWDVHDDLRAGVGLGFVFPLGERVALSAGLRRLVTRLQADIVNDPEDDGRDVDLDVDPWGFTAGLRVGFGALRATPPR